MSALKNLREKLNLTQEELADKSGISVRTIQRIESGVEPKGHTLKSLAHSLGVKEQELRPKEDLPIETEDPLLETEGKVIETSTTLIKMINLSSLPFIFIPFASIVIPLLIMFFKKKFVPITKSIVTIQILWLICAVTIFMLSAFMKNWFLLGRKFMPVIMILLVLSNVVIILRNAIEIDKKGKLFFKLNFSLI